MEPGAIPVKLLEKARATVTAGLANVADDVAKHAAKMYRPTAAAPKRLSTVALQREHEEDQAGRRHDLGEEVRRAGAIDAWTTKPTHVRT